MLIDILVSLCLITGSLMSLAAAAGLVRFPDLLTRLHSGSKPQVFGLLMMVVGIGLYARDLKLLPLLIVIFMLQLLTIPISTHMMARSGYRNKHFHKEDLLRDDLRARVEAEE
ncbi:MULTISPECIES: monovalent cation/H(+) antiporter subunit G [unclassified Rothia (in: high G+C Gram-positive bacteria)]|uniref:monovalent cation/H(+) antiporter subunit G n=1 Tax=unclassified Rothia (in: high G+C Gram-positive bacteria) TaxID=2689056 RepID=UPI001956421B|nr:MULTISPECIES: monovalent cation/H(+) antiporter subunit G [unclassified Rothia (in: high G+C Gram-positive bacteria)]MBM7051660.1 monovalent cation/H(+) antiporter subunit G [Rothia sp. ZJ1223]QRZ61701.1 monovalent cation/H(+) antiporter subunit G [Rothia sp. ZJ932]